jgi:hypothetical protein
MAGHERYELGPDQGVESINPVHLKNRNAILEASNLRGAAISAHAPDSFALLCYVAWWSHRPEDKAEVVVAPYDGKIGFYTDQGQHWEPFAGDLQAAVRQWFAAGRPFRPTD